MISPGLAVALIVVGCIIGVVSGMLGIGGGALVVPVLIFAFGFSQKQAIGTSLAMLLPPIGVFAFLTYWRNDNVNTPAAVILALTFALGAWLGSYAINHGWVSDTAVRRVFAFFLLYAAGLMLFRSDPKTWATVKTLALLAVAGLSYVLISIRRRKWDRAISAVQVYRRQAEAPFTRDFEI